VNQRVKTWMAGLGMAALVASAPAHGGVVRAIELVHTESGHYFQTAYIPEAEWLLSGLLNWESFWATTGQVYRVDDAPGPGLAPVCRFYTSAFAHKATHFFTAVQAECDAVKANPLWNYEGIAFYAPLPSAEGACVAGTIPVHRLYNNGQGAAPNHAYTTESARRDLLVQHGWAAEGTAYCAKLADEELPQLTALAGSTWDLISSGGGIFRSTFAASPTTDGSLAAALQMFGLPPTSVALAHAGPNGTGLATFDRIAGLYIVAADFHRPGGGYYGWTFEDPTGPVTNACGVDRIESWRYDGELSPVQPYILDCAPTRMFKK